MTERWLNYNMPLTSFICPDNKLINTDDCIKNCRRKEGRCLPLPVLSRVKYQRTWNGTPSTTQCLNPTRMEYLKLTKPYSIAPQDNAYAFLGIGTHSILERAAQNLNEVKAELQLKNGAISGITDEIEPDELNIGKYKLTDYKTWGSWAVAGFLNDPDNRQRHELELQLNNYRILAEGLGYSISRLQVLFIVRDGGIQAAIKNNVTFKMALYPVNILDNDYVLDFFFRKSQALKESIKNNTLPPLCEYNERWQGKRCKGFCDVFIYCPEGAAINKVKCLLENK